MKKSQQGFTIIEIVVALVVLGILMGAAATQLNRFRATSYQTAANNIAMSMQQAVNMKYASISQAVSASGAPVGTCTATGANAFCVDAYNAAVSLLAGTAATSCGVAFTAPTNPPFAATAALGGGWTLTNAIAVGGVVMSGPDGNPYTSEVPITSAANFCQVTTP